MNRIRLLALLVCILMIVALPAQAFALDGAEEDDFWQPSDGSAEGSLWRSAEWEQFRAADPNMIVRIAGKNRYETSMKVAEQVRTFHGGKYLNVILVSGSDFPDALGAAGPAYQMTAPIILVDKNKVKDMAQYIGANINKHEDVGYVYIMGGKGAVPETMEPELIAAGVDPNKIVRLSGSNRYETNLKVLKDYGTIWNLLICSGKDFADALSASALGAPIMLVGDELTDAQRQLIADQDIKRFALIGGKGVISEAIEAELSAIPNSDVRRFSGKNRYETSKALAEARYGISGGVSGTVLSYGLNFPDGLSGCIMCHMGGYPMLLATNSQISVAAECAHNLGMKSVIVMGGESLISTEAALTLIE